jgi:hypothetical protein
MAEPVVLIALPNDVGEGSTSTESAGRVRDDGSDTALSFHGFAVVRA